MTLKTACQDALREAGNIGVPSSFVGSTDPTAVRTLALARRAAREIGLDYDWTDLRETHTFNTAASTQNYSLPDDYHHFADGTFWDNANDRPVMGPVTARDWQWFQSGIASPVGINKAFRVSGGNIQIYPTPSAVEELVFQYYSDEFVTLAAGGTGNDFADDADTTVFDEDLLLLGIKWRVLAADGFLGSTIQEVRNSNEYSEYKERLNSLQGKDGGSSTIMFQQREYAPGNIPDTGFGS